MADLHRESYATVGIGDVVLSYSIRYCLSCLVVRRARPQAISPSHESLDVAQGRKRG